MTQKTAQKFINEVKRWARAEEGTNIWVKCANDGESWHLRCDVYFSPDCVYIVDDEWAELRKAQADGKQLQFKLYSGAEWQDGELSYSGMSVGNPTHWRIKPEAREKLKR